MKKIYFCLVLILVINVQMVKSQSVSPSVANFNKLAATEQTFAPPKFLKIGNEKSVEKEALPVRYPMPPGAIKKYQPDSLKNSQPSNSVAAASPAALNNFIGLNDNATTIPPDVHGEAGPNHLMVVHNSEFLVSDKAGALITKLSSTAFWSGVSPAGAGDPHINYNKYTNRWMMVAQSNVAATSALLVAVSQTSDPTGNWARYAFDVDATNTNWFDYPLVGFNQNWLVIAANNFTVAASTFAGSQIYIFDMAALSAGAAVNFGANAQVIQNATGQGGSLSPVTVYETGAPTNTMNILQTWNGSAAALRLTSLTGNIPSVVWNTGTAVFPIGPTPWAGTSGVTNNNSSPQATEPRKINSGDNRMCNTVMVNGKIWGVHHVFLPQATPDRAAIQWWQLQADGTVLQNGFIDDGVPDVHRTYPSIAVNTNEEVLIGYSKSTTTGFVSGAYSFRNSSTLPNTMDNEVVYKNGLAAYWKDFGGARCRWGDYSNTCLDPVTGRFWTLQEIANTRNGAGTVDNDSRWASWWAEVAPSAPAASVFFVNPGINVSETGTTGTCPRYKDITIPVGINGNAVGNATLTFTGAGDAINGRDYQVLTPVLNYINGDNTVKNITVRIFDDEEVETNETLVLSYSISGAGVTAASTGQLTSVYITNDDKTPIAVSVVTNSLGTLTSNLGNSSIFKGATASQEKMQHLYLASDMTAAGFGQGTVTSLSYYFNTATPTAYDNFTISMANSSATTLTAGGVFLTPVFTQVFNGTYTTPAAIGWSSIPLSSAFIWDGISNILVQVCYENAALSTDILLLGTGVSGYTPSVFQRQTTGNGCTFTSSTASSAFRPDILFTMNVNGPSPETNLNATKTVSFGPNAEIYIKNAANKIMARVKNLTSFDYGCTQFIIDRQGTAAVPFWNNTPANYLLSKSLKIIPANSNPSGSYEVSLYYTASEVNGWQTATGQSITGAQMVKVSNGRFIPDVTPATPFTADVSVAGITNVAYGTAFEIKAVFNNTSFSGFGVGIPASPVPVTSLSFTGYEKKNAAILNWTTTTENNTLGFEVEKSFDGASFSKIGYLKAAGNSSVNRNYLLTDPAKLSTIQFYRLKQIDLDGRSVYSNIVAIKKTNTSQMGIVSVSNPFKEKVKIIFTEAPQNNAVFELYDASGKMVMNTQQQVYSSITEIIVPAKLSKGNYFLRILVNDMVFNEQLIKQ